MNQKKQRFEQLVELYATDLHRYALWLTKNKEVSEDLVQEAFTRAWKNLHQLQDEKAAKAWLITIVRRENARRFQRIQPDLVNIEDTTLIADPELEPEAMTERRLMREAMMKLDSDYREPLIMQVIHGMSCREIAEMLNLTENAVMTRVFRAKQKIKDALTSDAPSNVSRMYS